MFRLFAGLGDLKKSLHFFSFYVKTKIFLTSISENQVPNLFPPTYKSVLVRQTFGRLKFEKPCCSLLLSPPQPPQHKTKMSFGLKREILLPLLHAVECNSFYFKASLKCTHMCANFGLNAHSCVHLSTYLFEQLGNYRETVASNSKQLLKEKYFVSLVQSPFLLISLPTTLTVAVKPPKHNFAPFPFEVPFAKIYHH